MSLLLVLVVRLAAPVVVRVASLGLDEICEGNVLHFLLVDGGLGLWLGLRPEG